MRLILSAIGTLGFMTPAAFPQSRSELDREILRTNAAMAEALERLESMLRRLEQDSIRNHQFRDHQERQALLASKLERLEQDLARMRSGLHSAGSTEALEELHRRLLAVEAAAERNRTLLQAPARQFQGRYPNPIGNAAADYDHRRTLANHYRFAPTMPVSSGWGSPEFAMPAALHRNWNAPVRNGPPRANNLPSILTGDWIADKFYPAAVPRR